MSPLRELTVIGVPDRQCERRGGADLLASEVDAAELVHQEKRCLRLDRVESAEAVVAPLIGTGLFVGASRPTCRSHFRQPIAQGEFAG